MPYGGVAHSISAMLKATEGPRGALAPKVRFLAEDICRDVTAKDYLSELIAVRVFVNDHIPYFRDPISVEWLRDPLALVEEIERSGKVRADCDEVAMLIAALWMSVGNEAEFVTVSFSPGPPTHVLTRCYLPKAQGPQGERVRIPIVCDPVAGTREPKMLASVVAKKIYPINGGR
jgi:hypothetical protein